MPSLCSIRSGRRSLRSPGRPVGVDQELRHEEQRDAAAARRRVRGARQHQVDDVVGQVVVAVGDEDLLAGDPVMLAPALVAAPAPRGCAARRGRSRPAARSGSSCRSIRRTPALADTARFCSGGAVRLQQLDRAEIEQRAQRPAHAGRVPHLDHRASPAPSAGPGRRIRDRIAAPSSRPRHSGDRPRGKPGGVRTTPFSRTLPDGRPAGSAGRARRRRNGRPRRGSRRRNRARRHPPAAASGVSVEHKAHVFDGGGIGHGGSLVELRSRGPSQSGKAGIHYGSRCGNGPGFRRDCDVVRVHRIGRLASAASAARRPVS